MSSTNTTFISRKDAAAWLSKKGVAVSDFDAHIRRSSTGSFEVSVKPFTKEPKIKGVKLNTPATPKAPKVPGTNGDKPESKASVERDWTPGETSIASVMKSMIEAGKSNAEIWSVVHEKFNYPAHRKGYIAWYRGSIARRAKTKGLADPKLEVTATTKVEAPKAKGSKKK